jgi:predicted O-methyltransferase YrrM
VCADLSNSRLNDVLSEVANLPENWHHYGVMTPPVLKALARHLQSLDIYNSVETGTGKSTLLISQVSRKHRVFTLDDSGTGDSYPMVRRSPLLRAQAVEFILGPTQKTLPGYSFDRPLQFALIDGPHGYPFPELEYYFIYPHLEPGSILVVDDIHIPTIGNMFRFLREDEMYQLIEVTRATAFFRRTDAPTFDPFGDGWQHQTFNSRRHPAHILLSERFKNRIPKPLKHYLKSRGFR